MKWTEVANNWAAFIEPIRERWPRLSENDLIRADGDRSEFTRQLAEAHDLTPAESKEQISGWLEGSLPSDVVMDEHHDNASIIESARSIPEGEDVYAEDGGFGDDSKTENPVGRTD